MRRQAPPAAGPPARHGSPPAASRCRSSRRYPPPTFIGQKPAGRAHLCRRQANAPRFLARETELKSAQAHNARALARRAQREALATAG